MQIRLERMVMGKGKKTWEAGSGSEDVRNAVSYVHTKTPNAEVTVLSECVICLFDMCFTTACSV